MYFVKQFMEWRGFSHFFEIREPGDVMYMMVIAAVRWPPVVFKALELREGFEPRTGKAEDWHNYLVRLVRFAHENSWKEMFDLISPGRSRCNFGLTWLCKHLRVIVKVSEVPFYTTGETKRLGVSQTIYGVQLPEDTGYMIKPIIDCCNDAEFRFPETVASSQDVLGFCKSVAHVIDAFVGSDSMF